MQDVSKGLGVRAKILHSGRRTGIGEVVADALSKGKMEDVYQEMPWTVDVSAGSCWIGLRTCGLTEHLARGAYWKLLEGWMCPWAGTMPWTWRISYRTSCWGEGPLQ